MTARTDISIEEAARKLGTTPVAVLMYIKQKRLKGTEIDGVWHVSAQDLQALCRENTKASPPHLCGGGCSGCSSKG